MNPFMNQQGNQSNNKFKTMLCRHYETQKGCMHKDKCQFAHGVEELRSGGGQFQSNNYDFGMQGNISSNKQTAKKAPNPQNYKIVKCVNFENYKTCKYGNSCTFAHGDQELRTKNDNSNLDNNNQMFNSNPNNMNFDPNNPMFMNMMMPMGGYPMMGMPDNNMFMYNNMGMMMPMDPMFYSGQFDPNMGNSFDPSSVNLNMNNMNFNNYGVPNNSQSK